MDDFNSNGSPERRLLGAIHAPHTANTHEFENAKATRKRSADPCVGALLWDLSDGKPALGAEFVRAIARARALRAQAHLNGKAYHG